jgi:TetR/AcrR family transcriptional regulator of autoinduction and epiphytic fitness
MSLQEFRDNRAQEKRAAVIEAATRLFAERGFNAVSMATLADEAGVSTATLYRHFEDKEAVFGEVIDALVRNVLSADGEASGGEDPDPLRTAALRYATILSDPVVLGLLRAVVADTEASTGFRTRLARHGGAVFANEFEQEIAALFAARAGETDQRLNVQQAGIELRALIEHFTMLRGLLFNEVPAAADRERLVDRTLESWRARWLG